MKVIAQVDSVCSDGTVTLTLGRGVTVDEVVRLIGVAIELVPLDDQPKVFVTNQRIVTDGLDLSGRLKK